MRVVVAPQVVNQDAYKDGNRGDCARGAGTGDAGERGDRAVNVGARGIRAACLSNWVRLRQHPSCFRLTGIR
jgi:hypothetical protein